MFRIASQYNSSPVHPSVRPSVCVATANESENWKLSVCIWNFEKKNNMCVGGCWVDWCFLNSYSFSDILLNLCFALKKIYNEFCEIYYMICIDWRLYLILSSCRLQCKRVSWMIPVRAIKFSIKFGKYIRTYSYPSGIIQKIYSNLLLNGEKFTNVWSKRICRVF